MNTILPPALRLTPPPANLGDILIRLREQMYEITGDLAHLGQQHVGAYFDFSRETSRWELKHDVYPKGQKGILWEMSCGDTPEEAIERFRAEWEKNPKVIALRESGQIAPPVTAASGKWVWVPDASDSSQVTSHTSQTPTQEPASDA